MFSYYHSYYYFVVIILFLLFIYLYFVYIYKTFIANENSFLKKYYAIYLRYLLLKQYFYYILRRLFFILSFILISGLILCNTSIFLLVFNVRYANLYIYIYIYIYTYTYPCVYHLLYINSYLLSPCKYPKVDLVAAKKVINLYPSINPSIYLFINQSNYLSVYHLSIYISYIVHILCIYYLHYIIYYVYIIYIKLHITYYIPYRD